mgnify:CR=1 FL=1
MAIDKGGTLGFGGSYTGTTQTTWGWIRGLKATATDGQTGGYLSFGTRATGSNTEERMTHWASLTSIKRIFLSTNPRIKIAIPNK